MKPCVPLIVALLCSACGDAPTAPSTPSASSFQRPVGVTSMRGEVMDTMNLPVSGAQVQILTGPGAGTVAWSDGNGQFVMPWTPSDSATVRVTREGFHAHQRTVPSRVVALRFDLEVIDNPTVIAGWYGMTLTASNECTQIPNIARRRTYRAQVYPSSTVAWFTATLFDGDFPYSSTFSSEVRREPLHALRLHIVTEPDWGNRVTTIVERIGPDMLLEFTGSADVPLTGDGGTAAFDGTLAVCADAPPLPGQSANVCRVQATTCRSANHRITWMRQ